MVRPRDVKTSVRSILEHGSYQFAIFDHDFQVYSSPSFGDAGPWVRNTTRKFVSCTKSKFRNRLFQRLPSGTSGQFLDLLAPSFFRSPAGFHYHPCCRERPLVAKIEPNV